MTYKEEHPYEQRKVYWARRPSSNHRGRRDGFHGQVSHGIHSRDGSRYDSSVLCRAAREFIVDLRGRNLVGLAVRFAQPPCGETGGVQSATSFKSISSKHETSAPV